MIEAVAYSIHRMTVVQFVGFALHSIACTLYKSICTVHPIYLLTALNTVIAGYRIA